MRYIHSHARSTIQIGPTSKSYGMAHMIVAHTNSVRSQLVNWTSRNTNRIVCCVFICFLSRCSLLVTIRLCSYVKLLRSFVALISYISWQLLLPKELWIKSTHVVDFCGFCVNSLKLRKTSQNLIFHRNNSVSPEKSVLLNLTVIEHRTIQFETILTHTHKKEEVRSVYGRPVHMRHAKITKSKWRKKKNPSVG